MSYTEQYKTTNQMFLNFNLNLMEKVMFNGSQVFSIWMRKHTQDLMLKCHFLGRLLDRYMKYIFNQKELQKLQLFLVN